MGLDGVGPLFSSIQMMGAQSVVPAPLDRDQMQEWRDRTVADLLSEVAQAGGTALHEAHCVGSIVFVEEDDHRIPAIQFVAQVTVALP